MTMMTTITESGEYVCLCLCARVSVHLLAKNESLFLALKSIRQAFDLSPWQSIEQTNDACHIILYLSPIGQRKKNLFPFEHNIHNGCRHRHSETHLNCFSVISVSLWTAFRLLVCVRAFECPLKFTQPQCSSISE